MNVEFWLENWQNHKIGFHQQETNSYLLAFWQQLNLPSNSRVLVPLCGKSLDLLWLCQQGHSIVGVEVSDIAVSHFFAENGLSYTSQHADDFCCYETGRLSILHGDFFKLSAEHVADTAAVFDRASLIALPPELRKRYATHLKSLLPASAKILLITLEYPQAEMDGPPFSVTENEVRALYQDKYTLDILCQKDVLDNYPRFRERGLTSLYEKVYLLAPP